MSNYYSFSSHLIPFVFYVSVGLFSLPVHANSDEVELLNSLLKRGLIAPEDYANEIKKQEVLSPIALATHSEINFKKQTSSNGEPTVDYQWVTAMNDKIEVSTPTSLHTPSSHGETGLHKSHNHFEGAYIVVTQEWKRPSSLVNGEKIKTSESAPSIGVGYTFALSNRATFGLKAGLDFKNGEFASGDVSSLGVEKKVLEKSHYSVAVEPGYVIGDSTLVFGILAYHHAKTAFEDGIESKGISGVGYGVGFKQSLLSNIFLMGEIQTVRYAKVTIDGSIVKPTSNTAALGLGYHF